MHAETGILMLPLKALLSPNPMNGLNNLKNQYLKETTIFIMNKSSRVTFRRQEPFHLCINHIYESIKT